MIPPLIIMNRENFKKLTGVDLPKMEYVKNKIIPEIEKGLGFNTKVSSQPHKAPIINNQQKGV